MLVPLTLALALTAAPAGAITATIGDVAIRREGRPIPAAPGAEWREGDRLETAAGAQVAVFLTEGTSICLGPESVAVVGGGERDRSVRLDRGEVRATVGGPAGLTIAAGDSRARVSRGILRAAALPEGVRLWAERGPAEVARGDARPIRLEGAGEAFLPRADARLALAPGTGRGWTIRPDDLRSAGVASAGLRLKAGCDAEVRNASAPPPAVDAPPGSPPPAAERPAPEVPAPTGAARAAPEAPTRSGPAEVVPEAPTRAAPAGTREAPEAPPRRQVTGPTRTNPDGATTPTPDDRSASQPIAVAQPNTAVASTAVGLALGNVSGSSSVGASGAIFSDAQQDSLNPLFPGNIHLVTAQTGYTLKDVSLRPADAYPATLQYWSIGLGKPPTSQVVTTFNTGSAPSPVTIPIPHFNAYLVHFPAADYGVPDPANARTAPRTSGISGLLGAVPVAPQVVNATPLTDPRAVFNHGATFALGEFVLNRQGDHPVVDLRRSDQDRQIIPSSLGSTSDKVTPNPQVNFVKVSDAKFFPQFPQGVYVPVQDPTGPVPALKDAPTYTNLDLLRKGAATTLLADNLNAYARRTGQTRFVLRDPSGHQSIVDITGYRPPTAPPLAAAAERARRDALMRSGFHSGRVALGGAAQHRHH